MGGQQSPPGVRSFGDLGGNVGKKWVGKGFAVCRRVREGKGDRKMHGAEAPEWGRKEQGQAEELQENSPSTAAAATFKKKRKSFGKREVFEAFLGEPRRCVRPSGAKFIERRE